MLGCLRVFSEGGVGAGAVHILNQRKEVELSYILPLRIVEKILNGGGDELGSGVVGTLGE